ncbi:PD-(D/E)XK motif protein [Mesorhizobium sp. M0239]|uniref:PD-(D/E)XK motif protein n=1 Tax=Mesorhizobium sp. M0239 TaxID=2956924 RepID=UPI0033353AF8
MQSDSPWNGLGRSGVDSRRVDQFGKWNFFWTVMPKQDPALALVLSSAPVEPAKLPALRSLETGFAALSVGPTFYLRLKDLDQLDLFEALCRDVVHFAEGAKTEDEALDRLIGRTNRWHHLLRGGRGHLLTEEEQKGLIGELTVLIRLVALIGPQAAIAAWKGPTGSPKDFEMHGHCIEVKSRRAAAQPFLQISNEFQLSDVEGHRLWLCVLAVDKVVSPFGETLNDIVKKAGSFLLQASALIAEDWDRCLSAAGYRQEDDYNDFRWVVSSPAWHEVAAGFPRVDLPLPQGVTDLKYTIALATCEPFAIDTSKLELVLSEGYANV